MRGGTSVCPCVYAHVFVRNQLPPMLLSLGLARGHVCLSAFSASLHVAAVLDDSPRCLARVLSESRACSRSKDPAASTRNPACSLTPACARTHSLTHICIRVKVAKALEVEEAMGGGGRGARARRWFVQPCSALTGQGVNEAMDWVLANIGVAGGGEGGTGKKGQGALLEPGRHYPREHIPVAQKWRDMQLHHNQVHLEAAPDRCLSCVSLSICRSV